jgi:hypothetical protein
MSPRKTFSLIAAAVGGLLLLLIVIGAVVWREEILRTWLDPKQPFQTYTPPPAPDYAKAGAWALIPAEPELWTPSDPPADVFFIHPTTFDGGRDWNGPIDDRRSQRLLSQVMLPNYAGPFQRVGRVFAPRYRQASLYAFMTNKEDAQESRIFAYGDVRRAFDLFLRRFNQGRPLIIVGVEQGGGPAERLLTDVVAKDAKLRARLAAAYLIETTVPAADFTPGAPIPACERRGEAGCVVAWASAEDEKDAEKTAKRTLVPGPDGRLDNLGARAPLCVNPLLGAASEAFAPARLNLGATSARGLEWGVRPAFLPRQVSAQCVGGFLRVSDPAAPTLKVRGDWTDRLKVPPFNLFYANEEDDAESRVAALIHAPGYTPPTPSSGAAILVRHAPVHAIP